MTYEKAKALAVRFFEANPDADSNQWDDTAAIFAAWVENNSIEEPTEQDWEDCKDAFEGEFKDAAALAEHICDECGTMDNIPEGLRCYFDYDAFGRDLLMGDYWNSGNYYFRCI